MIGSLSSLALYFSGTYPDPISATGSFVVGGSEQIIPSYWIPCPVFSCHWGGWQDIEYICNTSWNNKCIYVPGVWASNSLPFNYNISLGNLSINLGLTLIVSMTMPTTGTEIKSFNVSNPEIAYSYTIYLTNVKLYLFDFSLTSVTINVDGYLPLTIDSQDQAFSFIEGDLTELLNLGFSYINSDIANDYIAVHIN